jgi:transcriptional regulator with GAF, ATPase, and Fis domain
VRGAFTGAHKDRTGRFELADKGTLFLDEVGEIPPELQAKLLRVLQEGEFERVGDDRTRKVDVRVIAATNRDLEAEVNEGRFRRDLYYRLGVFPIEVPPLRQRREDIVPLAEHFLRSFARPGQRAHELTADQRTWLQSYDWPGNIRELQHVVERAVILSPGAVLRLDLALPPAPVTVTRPLPATATVSFTAFTPPHGTVLPERQGPGPTTPAPAGALPSTGAASPLNSDQWRALERDNLLGALERTRWRISGPGGAAELLGIRPSTLRDRMKALGIVRKHGLP